MKKYQYINGDTIVSTIQFDVISTDTRKVITSSSNLPDQPSYDFVMFPSGLGFTQEVDVVEGDTIDYVLKQTIKKSNIKLTLLWKGENAYSLYKNFLSWISKYNDLDKYHIRFSYLLGGIRRKVELAVTNLSLKERDGYRVSAELTMQPLSPFYEEEGVSITISQINEGKIYNYSYPYFYGGGAYSSENSIDNSYLASIPLKVTLTGPMENPSVSITSVNDDGSLGETYGRVQFLNLTITENDKLVIDSFNNKIYLETTNPDTGAVSIKDIYSNVNKVYDSFLFANPGLSKIQASLDNEYSKCSIYYVRYVL